MNLVASIRDLDIDTRVSKASVGDLSLSARDLGNEVPASALALMEPNAGADDQSPSTMDPVSSMRTQARAQGS